MNKLTPTLRTLEENGLHRATTTDGTHCILLVTGNTQAPPTTFDHHTTTYPHLPGTVGEGTVTLHDNGQPVTFDVTAYRNTRSWAQAIKLHIRLANY